MAFLISYLASRGYVTLRRQGGQALVEYGIILILVSVVCVVVLPPRVSSCSTFLERHLRVRSLRAPAGSGADPDAAAPCNGVCRISG